MTLSLVVIDELAAALGVEVPAELRASLARIEGAERGVTSGVTPGVTVTSTRAPGGVSKAALRTRRYRERLRARAAGRPADVPDGPVTAVTASLAPSQAASPSVTESVTVTSPVTVRDAAPQKNFPPDPPIRKTKNTKRGVTGRHGVTGPFEGALSRRSRQGSPSQAPPPGERVEVEPSDPLYREITAMRHGREPFVGKRGVAWIEAGEAAVARARMAERVKPLRPSAVAMHSAIGPPVRVRSG